ncbi:T9SS type B sorting domain-containing protein [uncultured Winogradskyella sp.]|uniref:T9SS type B sorting domain-containing protein n=1 Tax=uncultured Winogradskyella sp. TaxID=395353 RepID=UPI00260FD42F|nr:T9SS type B sorting domain-containing protein [uncultured Winogradskyella sp.]
MKRILVLLFIAGLCHAKIIAQGEATYWYFGVNAGLDFSTGEPILDLNGELITNEGCGTISDANGQLLFYTDGISVWDRNHNQMPNGFGLLGDPSSTQSGIIIPQPGSSTIYFVFTVDSSAGDDGFRYSIVDMSLNNGNGDVTSVKNIELRTPTVEKISAVQHANGTDFWILTHEWGNNNFLAYHITSSGINENPVVSSVGTIHGDLNPSVLNSNIANTIGYLKISPDGKRIASAKFGGENSNIEIFDFNDNTGIVSNPILIGDYFYEASSTSGAYGVEFSSDGTLLYVTDKDFNFDTNTPSSILHQFDITFANAQDIINSDTILYNGNNVLGALQLAVDGKIYVSNADKTALDVIENPNTLGVDANYQIGAVDLGGRIAKLGLPPFVQSLFNATFNTSNTCLGSETFFELYSGVNVTSALWDFDDGTTSNLLSPTHIYANPGTYTVTVNATVVGQSVTLSEEIIIYEIPVANTPLDYMLCEDLENDGFTLFNLNTKISEVIGSQSSQDFSVLFFNSESDALSGINPLDVSYNASSSQTIFARLNNNYNSSCFDITSFDLNILESPDIVENVTLYICENESLELNAEEGFDNYNWFTGQTTESIVVNSAGTYTVDIIKDYNTIPEISCSRTKIFTVITSNTATISDIEIEEWRARNSISVVADGLGDYEFSLDNIVYQDSGTFSDLTQGDYIVYVRDKNGCGIISKSVFVLDYPKFFTPNNDSYNPYWKIKFPSSERDFEILIYDRYGKQLASLGPESIGWDGTYNGKLMPASDYWFILKRPSKNKSYSGHFTLKR